MPDISMCANETCPRRQGCYRHEDSGTKPSEHRQSYMHFIGGDNCRGFLSAAPKMITSPKTTTPTEVNT